MKNVLNLTKVVWDYMRRKFEKGLLTTPFFSQTADHQTQTVHLPLGYCIYIWHYQENRLFAKENLSLQKANRKCMNWKVVNCKREMQPDRKNYLPQKVAKNGQT